MRLFVRHSPKAVVEPLSTAGGGGGSGVSSARAMAAPHPRQNNPSTKRIGEIITGFGRGLRFLSGGFVAVQGKNRALVDDLPRSIDGDEEGHRTLRVQPTGHCGISIVEDREGQLEPPGHTGDLRRCFGAVDGNRGQAQFGFVETRPLGLQKGQFNFTRSTPGCEKGEDNGTFSQMIR